MFYKITRCKDIFSERAQITFTASDIISEGKCHHVAYIVVGDNYINLKAKYGTVTELTQDLWTIKVIGLFNVVKL